MMNEQKIAIQKFQTNSRSVSNDTKISKSLKKSWKKKDWAL